MYPSETFSAICHSEVTRCSPSFNITAPSACLLLIERWRTRKTRTTTKDSKQRNNWDLFSRNVSFFHGAFTVEGNQNKTGGGGGGGGDSLIEGSY